MIIYLDLDGPILDVSAKYWHIYRDVLAEQEQPALPQTEYWALKRARTPVAEILARTGAEDGLKTHTQRRIARLETPPYLQYDQVWPGIREMLMALKQDHKLVLITLRRSTETLHGELERLQLAPLFDHVLSSGEQRTPRWRLKADLIRTDGYRAGRPGLIIGDTETEILAGQELGLQTVAVTFGIRAAEQLRGWQPDLLLHSPQAFVEWAATLLQERD